MLNSIWGGGYREGNMNIKHLVEYLKVPCFFNKLMFLGIGGLIIFFSIEDKFT